MNESLKIKRIYHPYGKWEDYKAGFYDNCSGQTKNDKIELAIRMFNSEIDTKESMSKVIELWKYSCEHNLTNEAVNKIAYVGQAACCIYGGVPSTVTMEAWSKLTKEVQERSNKIAEQTIENWKKQNKLIQLCLNFD